MVDNIEPLPWKTEGLQTNIQLCNLKEWCSTDRNREGLKCEKR